MKRLYRFIYVLIILLVAFNNKSAYATGWEKVNDDWYFIDSEGMYMTEVMKKSENETYYLDSEGKMVKNYFLEDYNNDTYYFDREGKMVKDTWVAVDPKLVDNGEDCKDFAYWYYFQNSGKAFRARNEDIKKYTIDGKSYVFNSRGQLQTGFIGNEGIIDLDDEEYPYKDCVYYADVYGVLKKGFVKYALGTDDERHNEKEELYLYFDENNYKKVYANNNDTFIEKTINGKKYAFDETGIMLSSWDYLDEYKESTASEVRRYYGLESDGSMKKKGWVYTVPSENINSKDYANDEARYFYFDNAGCMITGKQKRIDNKYYVFDENGIMKTGLVVFYQGKYDGCIDIDYTSAEMLSKYGMYYKSEDAYSKGKQTFISLTNDDYAIRYFNDNGERKKGNVKIDFTDDTVTFSTSENNAFSGKKKNKYYSNGILLKAKEECKYALVIEDDKVARESYEWKNDGSNDYTLHYYDGSGDLHACKIVLVDKSGKRKKKGKYKDKDEYEWIVNDKGYVEFDASHIPNDDYLLNFTLE